LIIVIGKRDDWGGEIRAWVGPFVTIGLSPSRRKEGRKGGGKGTRRGIRNQYSIIYFLLLLFPTSSSLPSSLDSKGVQSFGVFMKNERGAPIGRQRKKD
jgi:hypothetical protein